MKLQKNKGCLSRSLQAMSVIPLLVLGLVITIFSYFTVKAAMHSEVNIELQNMANAVVLTYDLLYPGDYELAETEGNDLLKGDHILTHDHSILDKLKAETQIDLTVFYQDTRILTTIFDENNTRMVGTKVSPRIVDDVLLLGKPHFYTDALIGEEQYFAYYMPLRNDDGTIVGMVYAGKPCADVNAAVHQTVFPIIIIALCSMVVVSFISSTYTQKLISSLQKIRTFLSKVSTGNLEVVLDYDVLQRNDELGEMGHSALYMQTSLRKLVEQDTLTELNNRRFADKRLKQTQMQANLRGTSFVIAIGDIDFFKSVNDTYGHECGDLVLKKVALTLKNAMAGKGFVARWGGEEFLFVYDDMNLEAAKAEAEKMLDDIRAIIISYNEQTIHVTMTFGLAEGSVGSNITQLLQVADTKLYEGKTNGRNRVVI